MQWKFKQLSFVFVVLLCATAVAQKKGNSVKKDIKAKGNSVPKNMPPAKKKGSGFEPPEAGMKLKTIRVQVDGVIPLGSQNLHFVKGDLIRAYVSSDASLIAIPQINGTEKTNQQDNISGWVEFSTQTTSKDENSTDQLMFEIQGDTEPEVTFPSRGKLYGYKDHGPGEATLTLPKDQKVKIKHTALVTVTDHAGTDYFDTVSVIAYPEFRSRNKTFPAGQGAALSRDLFGRPEPDAEIVCPDLMHAVQPKAPITTEGSVPVCDQGDNCPPKPELGSLEEKERAMLQLRASILPLLGRHIGNCEQKGSPQMEHSLLLKGVRALVNETCTNTAVTEAIGKMNEINTKRIMSGEKVEDENSKIATKVPPPQIRANFALGDIASADICTRTCIGEMGGAITLGRDNDHCRRNSKGEFDPTYQMAVVANINNRKRMTFSENNEPRWEYVNKTAADTLAIETDDLIFREPMVNVMLRHAQYSNWRFDSNQKRNHSRGLCPPNPQGSNLVPEMSGAPPPGKFYGGSKDRKNWWSTPNPMDIKSVESCTASCFEAVFDPEAFWKKTKDFPNIYYNSPPNAKSRLLPYVQGYPRIRNQKIGGQSLDKWRCVTVGNESTVWGKRPWEESQ